MLPFKKLKKSSFIVCSLLIFFVNTLNNSFAITIPEEKKLGKKFMEMIEKQHMILKDPIVEHMMTRVGNHVLSFLPPQPFDYSFYLVDDDVFNAFASPAANIFIYRGLITSLDSIDELAGIIGHEIAHAVSRHVSESIDRSKYINIGSLAGMLAGAIIASKTKGDAGTTIMQGSMAVGHTAMLAFTRENETEADEKGIMFLKKSCFSPEGLKTGLMKIRDSDFQGVEAIPDYVKTHPGTGSRIAHVETILSDYTPLMDKAVCKKDFRFDMVKYRLLGLYANIKPTFNLLQTQLADNPLNPALHYGMGLIYARKFMRNEALLHLKKALALNIFDPMILLEMGRVYLLDGKPQKAVNVLEGIQSDPVMGIMAKFHLGQAYLEMHKLELAQEYMDIVVNEDPLLYPKAYFNLAKIMSQQKQPSLSSFYLGQYYYTIKNYKNAKFHFTKALDTLDDADLIKRSKKLLKQIAKQKKPPA
ncbi:MAG: M48 family metalloprotease [Desulfobacula sp.]|nr:M48 family metalloprotease [Desulfobacula sp.]